MTRPIPLTNDEIDAALAALPGWELRDGALRRQYKFANFTVAFAWMTEMAAAAEAIDHHPDWRNVYNRVDVALSTHDAQAVTELDVNLARQMEDCAARHAVNQPPST